MIIGTHRVGISYKYSYYIYTVLSYICKKVSNRIGSMRERRPPHLTYCCTCLPLLAALFCFFLRVTPSSICTFLYFCCLLLTARPSDLLCHTRHTAAAGCCVAPVEGSGQKAKIHTPTKAQRATTAFRKNCTTCRRFHALHHGEKRTKEPAKGNATY